MTANRPKGHVPNVPAWSAVNLPASAPRFSIILARGNGDTGTVEELKAELIGGRRCSRSPRAGPNRQL